MEETLFYETLAKSKAEKEIIGIWQYGDDNGFLSVYVIDFNEHLVLFQHYSRFGKNDGIITLQIAGIQGIDVKDDYAKAMECLVEYSSILEKEPEFRPQLNSTEEWQSDLIKQLAKNSETLVSLEINGGYFSGYVKKATDMDFEMNCVGKMGEDEGNVIYRIEDVTEFRLHDWDDRKKDLLFKWRKASL
ncbi:hypothetical protein Q4599_08790 [Cellulophaga lytica]|uniref:hypothetical protein n=1 Tax=Cellulophaga lytica TaxID=979 RepID=UPI0026E1777D|nr:hypothetical protein [Cellulophaga lytica]MDO6853676.1 hypothetical protein [Cellulophaga lytica]